MLDRKKEMKEISKGREGKGCCYKVEERKGKDVEQTSARRWVNVRPIEGNEGKGREEKRREGKGRRGNIKEKCMQFFHSKGNASDVVGGKACKPTTLAICPRLGIALHTMGLNGRILFSSVI